MLLLLKHSFIVRQTFLPNVTKITLILSKIMRGESTLRMIKKIYEVLWGFMEECCHKILIGFDQGHKSAKNRQN